MVKKMWVVFACFNRLNKLRKSVLYNNKHLCCKWNCFVFFVQNPRFLVTDLTTLWTRCGVWTYVTFVVTNYPMKWVGMFLVSPVAFCSVLSKTRKNPTRSYFISHFFCEMYHNPEISTEWASPCILNVVRPESYCVPSRYFRWLLMFLVDLKWIII